jgi:hypothetical protein
MMIDTTIDRFDPSGGWIDVASHLLRTAAGPHQPIGNNMNDRSDCSLEQVYLHGDTVDPETCTARIFPSRLKV